MPKIITKKFTIYDQEDLQKDDELCNKIYEKFWLDSNNTNAWLDENIKSFETFAKTFYMILNYELSNNMDGDYRDFVVLTPKDDFYALDNKNYKKLLKNYKGIGYYMCQDLKIFTLKLLDKKEYKVLDESSTKKFKSEIENKMLSMWRFDNAHHFSKENFLEVVESNDYKFYEDGTLYKENEDETN
jgi:hypothetical protein